MSFAAYISISAGLALENVSNPKAINVLNPLASISALDMVLP
jgi:hypothetical protein